jgi:hypothetical protein
MVLRGGEAAWAEGQSDPAAGGLRTVRLLTGDRIVVNGSRVVDVERAGPLARTPMLRYVAGGDQYVLPAGSRSLIKAGLLDARLFNVTGLVRAGYGDARDAVPGLVSPPVALRAQVDGCAVRVNLYDRRGGRPTVDDRGANQAYFLDADTGDLITQAADGQDAVLPAGRYLVVAVIHTAEPRADFDSRSLIAVPGLLVTGSTVVTLDARIGNRVSVAVPHRTAQTVLGLVGIGIPVSSRRGDYLAGIDIPLTRYDDVYAGSPAGVTDPGLVYYHRHMLQEPELRLEVTAPEQFAVQADWYLQSARLVDAHQLTAVYAGAGTAAELAGLELRDRLVLLDLPPDDDAQFVPRLAQLGAAGARAALHVGATPPFPPDTRLPLPVGYAVARTAARLAALAALAPVAVRWRGLDGSPYRYDLSFPARGAIPVGQGHTLRHADLAQVRVTYAAQGAPGIGGTGAGAYFYGFSMGAGGAARVPRPMVRDEYLTPGTWALNSVNFEMNLEQAWQVPRLYRAGQVSIVDWHKAVLGPAFPPGSADAIHGVVRDGDTISCGLSMLSDGQGNPGEIFAPWNGEGADTVTMSQALYRDGALIKSTDQSSFAQYAVPTAAGRYSLCARVLRRAPWWQTATAITATWTFASGHTDLSTALPLLAVQTAAPVDEYNTATSQGPLLLPIHVYRQDLDQPVPISTLDIQYSTDDGRSWRTADVSRTGTAAWTARIDSPISGYLSLRWHIKDTAGNTLTQTTTRAIATRTFQPEATQIAGT